MPEQINAFIKAHAPGIGCISILFAIASFTISSPGSEIPGVPASYTSAIFFPSIILFINISDFTFSISL